MTQDISGQFIKDRKDLAHWAGLFEEWRLLNQKVCRLDPTDAPYWYNEMTNVSVLAGAAWRAGWMSLSEIQSEKISDKNTHWGRADLFIQNDFRYEYVEAKYSGANANDHEKFCEVAVTTLERAAVDANATARSSEHYATGVAFVAPKWSEKQLDIRRRDSTHSFDIEIGELVESVVAATPHAVAWSFPTASRDLRDGGDWVWPGVFLLVKNIWIK